MAKPFCALTQLFSKTLPSTSTRRAFFSSKMFFTDQGILSKLASAGNHRSWLDQMIMPELNVGGDQVRYGRI